MEPPMMHNASSSHTQTFAEQNKSKFGQLFIFEGASNLIVKFKFQFDQILINF